MPSTENSYFGVLFSVVLANVINFMTIPTCNFWLQKIVVVHSSSTMWYILGCKRTLFLKLSYSVPSLAEHG